MENQTFGSTYGSQGNEDKAWEKNIHGRLFFFSKVRLKPGIFLYGCETAPEHGTGTTPSANIFHSDRNLTTEEVENAAQFADFINGTK
jgi:hypothetical protein